MKNESNKTQKCSHSSFYSMNNDVYCNRCHEYLGYFDPVKLCGFVKKTTDTIKDELLNDELRKIDDGVIVKYVREKKKYEKPQILAERRYNIPTSRPCNPPRPGGR